jgi:hypothetical protein
MTQDKDEEQFLLFLKMKAGMNAVLKWRYFSIDDTKEQVNHRVAKILAENADDVEDHIVLKAIDIVKKFREDA